MKGKINKETRMITEVATLKKPDLESYYGRPYSTGMDSYDYDSYNRAVKKYEEHLASLRSFEYIGFDNVEDGSIVEFETTVQYFYDNDWHGSMSGSKGDIDRWCAAGEKTREIAKPAIPVPSNQESGEPDHLAGYINKIKDRCLSTPSDDPAKDWKYVLGCAEKALAILSTPPKTYGLTAKQLVDLWKTCDSNHISSALIDSNKMKKYLSQKFGINAEELK